MIKDFKVGDKVTCIRHGKGTVININNGDYYPITAKFKNEFINLDENEEDYTFSGERFIHEKFPSLHHGHGEFKIEFVEDKEVEYEYKWIFMYVDTLDFNITNFYRNIEELKLYISNDIKIISRIEESKREVKYD